MHADRAAAPRRDRRRGRYLTGREFSGAWFDTLGGRGDEPDVAGRFTPADLVAVTTLGVRVSGWAAIQLLDTRADDLAALLDGIPTDVVLHEARDDHLESVFAAQRAIDQIDGVGHVTRSKLLARKRPHLVPIRDQHVLVALVGRDHGDFTRPLRDALATDDAVRDRLAQLRAGAGRPDLSLLRTLDIVVWMRAHGAASVDEPDAEPPAQSGLALPKLPLSSLRLQT